MVLFIGSNVKLNEKFEKFWNNKSNEQILLNLIGQYGVQNYFVIRNFNELCINVI